MLRLLRHDALILPSARHIMNPVVGGILAFIFGPFAYLYTRQLKRMLIAFALYIAAIVIADSSISASRNPVSDDFVDATAGMLWLAFNFVVIIDVCTQINIQKRKQ